MGQVTPLAKSKKGSAITTKKLGKVYPNGVKALSDVNVEVSQNDFVVVIGSSGSGKSTLLRSLYANYMPQTGSIRVRHGRGWVDMVGAEPRQVLMMRRATLGYVSQFLRVIPRVPALEIVARARWAVTGDKDEVLEGERIVEVFV